LGIAPPVADLLTEFCATRGVNGRCLTLGRQDVQLRMEQFVELMVKRGIMQHKDGQGAMAGPPEIMDRLSRLMAEGKHLSSSQEFAKFRWISDELFFTALGFQELHSTDVNAYENATHIVDLNEPGLGRQLSGQYDLVIDGGTLEHCFDVPTALRNIFDALAVGGYAMHISPVNNYVDHGFYQFCPTLFHDYYEANGFELSVMKLYRHTQLHLTEPWQEQDYNVGDLDGRSYGGLDDGIFDFVCLVRKTEFSTAGRKPSQSRYKKYWT